MSSDDDASVSTEGDDAVFSEKSDPTDSEEENSEESDPPRRRKRKLSSDESFSSDDSYKKKKKRKKIQKKPAKAKSSPRTPRPKDVKKVVYKEDESESEEDEESEADDADLLEDEDTLMTEVSTMQVDDSNAETIEKVLKHREGIPGAIGPPTTAYNVEEKGDPNKGVEDKNQSELERQFLIKWVGWSHLHNTWESLKSLNGSNVKGIKKLENYIKKLDELEFWKSRADKEYIEHYDCEQEMNDELLDEYKKVERVIAHQVSREKNAVGEKVMEYLIKWACLPYSDCTWEDEGLIQQTFSQKIDEYYTRINSKTLPNKINAGMLSKRRPKFTKLDEMPDYLRPISNPDMELRDYQLEGLNWLLHAWSRENSCILADEMGLGKTIQTISFLSSLFHLHDVHGPFLIVVPLSTMTAWQREFELWAPTLNAVVYMGDVSSREQIRNYELLFANSRKIKVNALLTTYEILLKDKAFLSGFDWAALMVDEAHRLKNDESLLYQCLRNFSTAHRLLITGTPLQNSLKELWALLHFIMPDKLIL
uniref:DNA helicase n=1 Tax=Panagrolaimus superbus TaxID=310955 RepID=A0A914Z5J4_9BILA